MILLSNTYIVNLVSAGETTTGPMLGESNDPVWFTTNGATEATRFKNVNKLTAYKYMGLDAYNLLEFFLGTSLGDNEYFDFTVG